MVFYYMLWSDFVLLHNFLLSWGVWKSGNPESGIGTGIGTGTGTGTGIGTGMGRETYIKAGTTFTLI